MSALYIHLCQVGIARCCIAHTFSLAGLNLTLKGLLQRARARKIKVKTSLQKSLGRYKLLLRARSICTFDRVLPFTYHGWSVFWSQCCSDYLGLVVIVECSRLLMVSLKDGTIDFMWQQHFAFQQGKHADVWAEFEKRWKKMQKMINETYWKQRG